MKVGQRPTLAVSVITKNSATRLKNLIAQLNFADEVIVGVDHSSTDDTLHIARQNADYVYRFQHDDSWIPARMLPFQYTKCDWILSMDDDELLENSFLNHLDSMLTDQRVTHHWLPRKWLVSDNPLSYIRTKPWFPDWQLRLFRNDLSLIWRSPKVHRGYGLIGPGHFQTETALIHYERIITDKKSHIKKIETYRKLGSDGACEALYGLVPKSAILPLETYPLAVSASKPRQKIFHEAIHRLQPLPDLPLWKAELEGAACISASPAEHIMCEIRAKNLSQLAWSSALCELKFINLSYHIYKTNHELVLYDGLRTRPPRFVRPGESILLFADLLCPAEKGDYVVVWDFVSEHEAWFEQCGSTPFRQMLKIK